MQCNQMVPDRTKTGRLKKPNTYSRCEGRLEIRTSVMLDADSGTIKEDGTVVLDDITFSHLNDHLDGHPLDLEADFELTCAECGHHYEQEFSDGLMQRVGLQPIGNAERTLGLPRGGMTVVEGDSAA